MYGPPRCCKGKRHPTATVRTNVSGLLQARRCYAQAKMSIRTLRSQITGSVSKTVFGPRAYGASIRCSVICSIELANVGMGVNTAMLNRTCKSCSSVRPIRMDK
jgi:hypothetical protein